MLKALLVDLDGTLVNTQAANIAAYKEALQRFGFTANEEDLRRHVGRLAWRDMLSAVVIGIDDATAAAVAEAKRDIYPRFFDLISVNTSLIELINCACPPLKAGLVTSASRASAHAALKHLALFDLFGVIVTSDDCPSHKPDPAPYRLAAEALSVKADECLVIEDSDLGLASAQAFGAQTLQVHWRTHAV